MATMDELAQTIATAETGNDVREAMAEAVRQFDTVKGAVYQRMKEISDENEQLSNRLESLETTHTADVTAIYKAIQQTRDDLTRAFSDADKTLSDRITSELTDVDNRLMKLEALIYDGQPAYVDDGLPPQASTGSTEITDDPKQAGSVIMVPGKEIK